MANKKASNRYKAPQRNNPTRKFRVWKVPGIKFPNFEKVDFLIIFWPKKYPFSKLEEEVWGRRGPLELELSVQTWSKDVILCRKNKIWRVYSPKVSLKKFTFFLNRYFAKSTFLAPTFRNLRDISFMNGIFTEHNVNQPANLCYGIS